MDSAEWGPHPFATGLDQVVLLSQQDDGADVTVYAYRGHGRLDSQPTSVPKHLHEVSDDITYVLRGAATVEIEGHDDVDLKPGSFLCIPAGRRHAVRDTTADFYALNIFAPPRE